MNAVPSPPPPAAGHPTKYVRCSLRSALLVPSSLSSPFGSEEVAYGYVRYNQNEHCTDYFAEFSLSWRIVIRENLKYVFPFAFPSAVSVAAYTSNFRLP